MITLVFVSSVDCFRSQDRASLCSLGLHEACTEDQAVFIFYPLYLLISWSLSQDPGTEEGPAGTDLKKNDVARETDENQSKY